MTNTRRDVEMYEEDATLRRAKEERDMQELATRLQAISLVEENAFALPVRVRRDVVMYEEDDVLRAAQDERDMCNITARLKALALARAEAMTPKAIADARGLKRLRQAEDPPRPLHRYQNAAHEATARAGQGRSRLDKIARAGARRAVLASRNGGKHTLSKAEERVLAGSVRKGFAGAAAAHKRVRCY